MFRSAATTWAGVSGSGRVEHLLGVPLVSDSRVTVTNPLPHLILGASSLKGKEGAKTRLSHRQIGTKNWSTVGRVDVGPGCDQRYN